MPPKKYKKRRYRKRKRYTRRRAPGTGTTPTNSPLARTLKANFKFSENRNLVSAGAVPASYVYSLNGLYDPNITGAGAQPRGFDELMQLYDHYCVIAVRIRIDWSNNLTGNPTHVIAAIRDGSTTSSTLTDYVETGNTKYMTLGTEGGGNNVKSMYINLNPNKFLGRSKPLADPNLKGTVSANPNEQAYLILAAVNTDEFTNTNTQALITIEYTAILFEPKVLSAS